MPRQRPSSQDAGRFARWLFSENVRAVRMFAHRTVADCAETLGVTGAYWRALEGGRKSVSIARAAEVAEVLGVPLARLFESND